ncbi:class C sortase [Corynebacterium sp. ES2794-CONJ1]|uniref:class C sortase n=1 Tax=unclassified Corynebacterium TaxID=2624378 RepID=UPI00216840A7|nr:MULTISPECIES: class C sortase [unclassified Corynebacterium]MCS4489687.1 class C sortase [Corynebacterium sp. ES2775-CONJ]MCS4491304.1 class C sortase [Corynebacterium sp. ES2715-CONJ3]MCU9518995.1 class C sortase [Corynebacterium sp. ES2794-CONJ1]
MTQLSLPDRSNSYGFLSGFRHILLPALLVLSGLLIIIYPVVSTEWNNWQQSRAAAQYAEIHKDIPAPVIDREWEDAHRYNEERAIGPILDPWIERFISNNPAYEDYLEQLHSVDVMARLTIPSIRSDLPIYHGTQKDTLLQGIGHLFGSDLPVGGAGSHSILTGHTGLPNATLFDNLKNVKEGDSFFIQVAGHQLKYQVDQIRTVLPNEVESLRAEDNKDMVTLVTCTPYGINTHRLLVRGQRMPLLEEDRTLLNSPQSGARQWWVYALSAIFIFGLLILVWWLIHEKRRLKFQQLNHNNNIDYEGEL